MKHIQVLGTGCSKCHKLTEVARAAAEQVGKPYELEHVTDVMRFAELGVMSIPALVVDGKVLAVGRVPRQDEIAGWLA
jgi:small redox-active disulfide protein 2